MSRFAVIVLGGLTGVAMVVAIKQLNPFNINATLKL